MGKFCLHEKFIFLLLSNNLQEYNKQNIVDEGNNQKKYFKNFIVIIKEKRCSIICHLERMFTSAVALLRNIEIK